MIVAVLGLTAAAFGHDPHKGTAVTTITGTVVDVACGTGDLTLKFSAKLARLNGAGRALGRKRLGDGRADNFRRSDRDGVGGGFHGFCFFWLSSRGVVPLEHRQRARTACTKQQKSFAFPHATPRQQLTRVFLFRPAARSTVDLPPLRSFPRRTAPTIARIRTHWSTVDLARAPLGKTGQFSRVKNFSLSACAPPPDHSTLRRGRNAAGR